MVGRQTLSQQSPNSDSLVEQDNYIFNLAAWQHNCLQVLEMKQIFDIIYH